MSHNTHITLKCRTFMYFVIFLLRLSFTIHHHCAMKPHCSNKFLQLEVSRNVHHINAVFGSSIGTFWLGEPTKTSLQNAVWTSFIQYHRLKWAVAHIIQSVVKIELHQSSSTRVSWSTPHSRMSNIQRSSIAMLRVSSSRPQSSAINLHK